jgi:hypothetical protein
MAWRRGKYRLKRAKRQRNRHRNEKQPAINAAMQRRGGCRAYRKRNRAIMANKRHRRGSVINVPARGAIKAARHNQQWHHVAYQYFILRNNQCRSVSLQQRGYVASSVRKRA